MFPPLVFPPFCDESEASGTTMRGMLKGNRQGIVHIFQMHMAVCAPPGTAGKSYLGASTGKPKEAENRTWELLQGRPENRTWGLLKGILEKPKIVHGSSFRAAGESYLFGPKLPQIRMD